MSSEGISGLGARKQYNYNMECANANGFSVSDGFIDVVILRTCAAIDNISFFEDGGGGPLVEWLSGSCKQYDKFAS